MDCQEWDNRFALVRSSLICYLVTPNVKFQYRNPYIVTIIKIENKNERGANRENN